MPEKANIAHFYCCLAGSEFSIKVGAVFECEETLTFVKGGSQLIGAPPCYGAVFEVRSPPFAVPRKILSGENFRFQTDM